jgi:hypothetical protein
MPHPKARSFSFAAFMVATILFAQPPNAPADYLKVPGPVVFDKMSYNLSWSAHPSATYYKQEYLSKGQNADRFQKMLMLEVLTGKVNVKDIADSKVAELKSMKAGNPFVTYELTALPTKDEYLLDFLVTQNSPDGKSVLIAERNVYHYKPFIDKTGHNGVVLFAVSVRSYDAEVKSFLEKIKTDKADLPAKMKAFPVPNVSLK